ncbi:hypothetical protein C2S53_010718 [Perilla frutescens var. hirtella]|uniref:Uncharacterized protein n=1 Tax=Perilla frutescens var. hirtella TaxID=608512 RepID=A0AAD4P3E6_PERFH|nr:hypothetical protein C2S53_010718 [Perilla frutescens var. hirtella]
MNDEDDFFIAGEFEASTMAVSTTTTTTSISTTVVEEGVTVSTNEVLVGNEKELGFEIVYEVDSDGKVLMLELERAINEKLHTHNLHCSNCKIQITKVILSRKDVQTTKGVWEKVIQKFHYYRRTCIEVVETTRVYQIITAWVLIISYLRPGPSPSIGTVVGPPGPSPPTDPAVGPPGPSPPIRPVVGPPGPLPPIGPVVGPPGPLPPTDPVVGPPGPSPPTGPVVSPPGLSPPTGPIVGPPGLSPTNGHVVGPPSPSLPTDTVVGILGGATLLEILKCIVYGGLIESITSLSFITATFATDATTLNVLAIGLAIVFSGLIAFGYNLVELWNDVDSDKKYKELLGHGKEHFIFHATFTMLSYLVFGLIAPTTYGFAFRESDNKDYKMIVVFIVSFACIFILAMAKAYVIKEKEKVSCYVKTTRIYLSMTVIASGVAYALGYFIQVLMLKLNLFKSARETICVVSESPAVWASY